MGWFLAVLSFPVSVTNSANVFGLDILDADACCSPHFPHNLPASLISLPHLQQYILPKIRKHYIQEYLTHFSFENYKMFLSLIILSLELFLNHSEEIMPIFDPRRS